MNDYEAIRKMVSPQQHRPGIQNNGIIQIWLTRSCDRSCFGCTQGSNLKGSSGFITLAQFQQACESLKDYFGTVGIFGGNPTLHPEFESICAILRDYIPRNRRGLWCNRLFGHGQTCRKTFDPSLCNLNTHRSKEAYEEFKNDWPECKPFGLTDDSRHSPPYVAIQDIVADEDEMWNLIAGCDINKHWSAMIAPFRGELRGYFCEIAGAQAILHQEEPDYEDHGFEVIPGWWKHPIEDYSEQIKFHCPACGVPLRGYGELACSKDEHAKEQVSLTHQNIFIPKQKDRIVELVETREQLGQKQLHEITDYLGNAKI